MEESKCRKKDRIEILKEIKTLDKACNDVQVKTNQNHNKIDKMEHMISIVLECLRVQQVLDTADEHDKNSFGL